MVMDNYNSCFAYSDEFQSSFNVNWGTIGHNGIKYAVDNYFRPFNRAGADSARSIIVQIPAKSGLA